MQTIYTRPLSTDYWGFKTHSWNQSFIHDTRNLGCECGLQQTSLDTIPEHLFQMQPPLINSYSSVAAVQTSSFALPYKLSAAELIAGQLADGVSSRVSGQHENETTGPLLAFIGPADLADILLGMDAAAASKFTSSQHLYSTCRRTHDEIRRTFDRHCKSSVSAWKSKCFAIASRSGALCVCGDTHPAEQRIISCAPVLQLHPVRVPLLLIPPSCHYHIHIFMHDSHIRTLNNTLMVLVQLAQRSFLSTITRLHYASKPTFDSYTRHTRCRCPHSQSLWTAPRRARRSS